MKHWIAFAGIFVLGIAAIVWSEQQKVDAPASPAAILYFVADTERELTRMPTRFIRMSDAEEIRVGNEIARGYVNSRDVKDDPETAEIEAYLTEVGSRLAANTQRKLPYRFHYIPGSYFINAFALPGGHVFVGEGLLTLMDSEDELAAVMGHEIEHIDHYHCSDHAQQEAVLRHLPLGALVALPVEVFEAGYTKDQEAEADAEGVRLSVKAGYSQNGALRMFETLQRVYNEAQVPARDPGEEAARVAAGAMEGYFRSHPLPAERIAAVRKLIADEHWEARSERDLKIGYIGLTTQANRALREHQYAQAQQWALRALQARPGRVRTLVVLAQAQFAQADFAGAAGSYRKLLDLGAPQLHFAADYGHALAVANRQTAAATFHAWAQTIGGEQAHELKLTSAGLALLAGDPSPAKAAKAEALNSSAFDWGPRWLAELGWWYYLAGENKDADDLLLTATQWAPGNHDFLSKRAWVQIEARNLADALQTVEAVSRSGGSDSELQMAHAVAFWQAKLQREALERYEQAVSGQPEWENPRWVNVLYAPGVEEAIQQMKAEQERRKKAAEGHK